MPSSHEIVSHPFTVNFIQIKARQLCRRSDFSLSDCEDLQQEMRLYLLEKAHLFDPQRGNVEAFVTTAINSWVGMHLRYRGRQLRRDSFKATSLERTRVECDGDVTSLGAVLLEEDGQRLTQAEPESPIEDMERREAVEHVMQRLSPEDRALLNHVAEHGVASAARQFNVSRRQVDNALARMRVLFEEAGLSPM